jgi:hypothetical protein
MSFPKLSLSQSVGLFIAMIPLGANADTGQNVGQIACPTLLTELECNNYQAEQRQARSEEERALFEDKYTTLLKERSRLCPLPISLKEAEETKGSLDTKRLRLFAGRKIGM